ncbi:MAG: glycosyltransferase family 4 protein [Planctomycetes bacterium]|nr:glycosyltransferase family 4 protein [Planctomycetota bacterium]
MRLAIVRQQYRADGGAERFTSSLIAALGENRYDVTVLARRWQELDGVAAIRCNPPRMGRLSRDWGFALSVDRQLREHHFDLVQSNERVPGCDVYRAGDGVHRQWLVYRRRVQSWPARVFSALSPYHAYLQWVERRVFEHPRLRAVICNSQMVRQEILKYFRVDPAKLHVIYNAVDCQRFGPHLKQHRAAVRSEFGVPSSATLFVFVGSGFERKGLRYAIEGLTGVAGAHLLVVGGDKQTPHYVRLAQKLGVAQRTHFAGVRSDVGPCYGAADALLLPTLYDPMPNVALEAMATGLPSIVSTACGAAELIVETENCAAKNIPHAPREEDHHAERDGYYGECGLVCDALDHAALVRAMQTLTDRQVAERLGCAARLRVELLTPGAMVAQLTALYRKLLT